MIAGFYFVTGLVLTTLFIPLVKRISHRIGYTDVAQGDVLKIHKSAIPHSGGIAIFGIFGLLFVILLSRNQLTTSETFGFLSESCIAFVLGIWDDLKTTLPVARLSIQVLAGMILIFSGHFIQGPAIIGLPFYGLLCCLIRFANG